MLAHQHKGTERVRRQAGFCQQSPDDPTHLPDVVKPVLNGYEPPYLR